MPERVRWLQENPGRSPYGADVAEARGPLTGRPRASWQPWSQTA